jgi:hypothetical protein
MANHGLREGISLFGSVKEDKGNARGVVDCNLDVLGAVHVVQQLLSA